MKYKDPEFPSGLDEDMNQNKIEEIYDSYVNGNITITRAAIKKMSKHDFLAFVKMISENDPQTFWAKAFRLL